MKRKSVKKNKLLHSALAILAIFLGVSIYLLLKNGSGPLAFVTNPLLMAPLDEGNSMYNASTKTLTAKNDNGSVTVTKTSTQTDMSEARNGTGKAVVNKVVTTTQVDSNRNLVSTTNKISSVAVEANGDPDPTQNVTTVDRTVTFNPGIKVPSNSDLSNSDLTDVLKVKENVASTTIKSVTTDANGLVVSEKSQFFGANEIAKLTATGVAGSKTCATNGSPVLEGTWVATGATYTDPNSGKEDTTQRQCVKCGSDGRYGNSSSCSQIFISGAPMVLPTGGGVPYTGKDISIKPCFIKKDVGFVQVGTGHIEGDTVCNTNGVMTKLDDAKTDMDKYCGVIKSGDVYKNGKCQPLVDQKTLDAETKYKADEAKAKAAADEAKAKAAAAAKALAAKELALSQAKKSYSNKSDCEKALLGTSTLECYPTGPIGSQIYAMRTKAPGSVTYVSCPMADKSKEKMADVSKGCGSVTGSIASFADKNTKFEKGNLMGGETTKNLTDCRFGGSPSRGSGLNSEFLCNDYTGKAPSIKTADPVNSSNTLTPDQKSKLNKPSEPWSATNPVLVKKESDCPAGSNIDSVYLPNDTGKTYRCTPKQQSTSVDTTELTQDQKNKLNNPQSPWSATNPVLVKSESDCPNNSNIDTVYLPNESGATYRCTPKSNNNQNNNNGFEAIGSVVDPTDSIDKTTKSSKSALDSIGLAFSQLVKEFLVYGVQYLVPLPI